MDNNQWEINYSKGKELNRFPVDDLVSTFFRNKALIKKVDKSLDILEIGCGCGNNLWLFSNDGHNVTGLDLSKTAIEFAKKTFEQKGLKGQFIAKNFLDYDLEEESYDFIIDRACITHNPAHVEVLIDKVYKLLRPGGLFYSWIFDFNHSERENGEEITYCGYDNFPKNTIWENIPTFFLKKEDILKYFKQFHMIDYKQFSIKDSKNYNIAYFSILLQK